MYEYSYPIIGGTNDEYGKFDVKDIVGTAFHIGENCFITAGHVISQLRSYDLKALGKQGLQNEKGVATLELVIFDNFEENKDFEIFKEKDIGIFRIEVNPTSSFLWCQNLYFPPELFKTFGYAFALNLTDSEIYIRSILGNIVSSRNFKRFDIKSKVYELSEICPKGISGAFLLNENLNVIGLIIGNGSSEIEIAYEEETKLDKNGEIIFLKTEVMKYGIAIVNDEIFKLESSIIGGSILNHLKKNELLKEK